MIVMRNATLLDPASGELTENASVVIEGDRIREVSAGPTKLAATVTFDAGGRTLMPGLIDSHVHVFLSEVNIRALESVPLTLMTARGVGLMRAMLDRGFTTVRDTGGADWGIREGVADGVDEVRRAVREQLRQGVDHIKIMASGGVASPYDPLESLQYTTEEIRAAVEEAAVFKRYVCAHAYAAEAVARAVENGVRVIEHGNLIDAATAKLMAARGAFLVPTLVAYDAIERYGGRWGMSAASLDKNKVVMAAGLRALELAREAGVRMAFGSDLLGQLQPDQSREFLIRSKVLSPLEIIRSATVVGAELLGLPGELGTVAPGAFADLLVVDGNPLRDLSLLQGQGEHLSLIMKAGTIYKNRL